MDAVDEAAEAASRSVSRLDDDGACPLTWTAPFQAPWRKPLDAAVEKRLRAWCSALMPAVAVRVVEWIGADVRRANHAVVVSLPGSERAELVMFVKSEELRRAHVAEALGVSSAFA